MKINPRMLEKDDIVSVTINQNGDILKVMVKRIQESPYKIDTITEIDKGNLCYILAYNKRKIIQSNLELINFNSINIVLSFLIEQ